jgi:hypothetical protein
MKEWKILKEDGLVLERGIRAETAEAALKDAKRRWVIQKGTKAVPDLGIIETQPQSFKSKRQ